MQTYLLCIWVGLVLLYIRSSDAGYCTQSYTCGSTCYRQKKYTTGCGWFRRCTKTRKESYWCTKTCYRRVCCKGYTGVGCRTPLCFGNTTCPNGGKCVKPDMCSCLPGYAQLKCQVCSSSRLPRVANGVYRQHTSLSSVATLTCNSGFEPKGSGIAVCQSTGAWSSSSASCQPTDCGQPLTTIADGRYVLLNGSQIGNQALIECNENHVVQGSPTFIQCLTSGYWSTSSATCVPVCPDGWVEFGGNCYLFGRLESAYTTARKYCMENKSALVQVDTVKENDFLKRTMEKLAQDDPALEAKYGYWNDAFESTSNGKEVWRETNTAVDPEVTDWFGSQPDDAGGKQTCTMFWKDFQYQWADIECDAIGKANRLSERLGRALCERPKNG